MNVGQIKDILKGRVANAAISRIVETEDSYIVSIQDINAHPFLQPPYKISKSGKVSWYNIRDRKEREAYSRGKVLFSGHELIDDDAIVLPL